MKYSGRKGNWVPIDHYDDDWLPLRLQWQTSMRHTVIRTAMALLAEVGPRTFTVKEVALRSGIGRTTIYKYFGIKADLLLLCREKAMSPARQRITACLQGRTGLAGQSGVQAAAGPGRLAVGSGSARGKGPVPPPARGLQTTHPTWLERVEAALHQAAARAGAESDLWLLTAAEGIRSYRPPHGAAADGLSPVPAWLVDEVSVMVRSARYTGELPEVLDVAAAAELICACWWYYLCAFKPWSAAGMSGCAERWGTAIRHVARGLAGA